MASLEAAIPESTGMVTAVPELESIAESDVRDWCRVHASAFGVPDSKLCRDACSELFAWWRRRRPMESVVEQLEKLINAAKNPPK